MSDATDAILDIIEAIDEYGSSITFNKVTVGVYDPVTGDNTNTTVSTAMKALPSSYSESELQHDNIHIKDKRFRLYYNGTIEYTDTIVFKGDTYSIQAIDAKVFQDETIIYTIQGRI